MRCTGEHIGGRIVTDKRVLMKCIVPIWNNAINELYTGKFRGQCPNESAMGRVRTELRDFIWKMADQKSFADRLGNLFGITEEYTPYVETLRDAAHYTTPEYSKILTLGADIYTFKCILWVILAIRQL